MIDLGDRSEGGRVFRDARIEFFGFKILGKAQRHEVAPLLAAAEPVDVVGVSCHSWEYMTLVPELLKELKARGVSAPVVIGGSVITQKDAEQMLRLGVGAVVNGAPSDDQIIDTIRRVAKGEAA